MGAKKRLQKLLDKANKGTGNTTEATDNRDEIQEALVSSGKGNLVKRGKRLYEKMNKGSGIKMVSPLNAGMGDGYIKIQAANERSYGGYAQSSTGKLEAKLDAKDKARKEAKTKKNIQGRKAVKDVKKVTDQGNKTKGITMISPLDCWRGYERVAGTKEFSPGSCKKA